MNSAPWLVGGAVVIGFLVGFGVGKETRGATKNHIESEFDNGVLVVRANVGDAFSDGVANWLRGGA